MYIKTTRNTQYATIRVLSAFPLLSILAGFLHRIKQVEDTSYDNEVKKRKS